MRRRSTHLLAVVAFALGVAAVAPTPAAAEGSEYTITDIGTLNGRFCAGFTFAHSDGLAVNSGGDVAGRSCRYVDFFDPVIAPFSWSGGVITALGPRAGTANGINDARVVVGSTGNPDFASGQAFVNDAAGFRQIPGLASLFSVANDVTNAGLVVGYRSETRIDSWTAFSYDLSTGSVSTLPGLGGWFRTAALAANDGGTVVGYGSTAENVNVFHAIRWDGGVPTDLGALAGASHSFARAVNGRRDVVGDAWLPTGGTHAILWRGGSMIDLGTLGGRDSAAFGINDLGVIVGYSLTSSGQRAFVYSGGVMRDLNALIPNDSGWTLTIARAINTSGQIVGTGTFGGESRAFLLTPTGPPPDRTPPELTVPLPISVNATSTNGATVTFAVAAFDAVDGVLTPTCDRESGALFPIGSTTVTCTATDASQNSGTASFVVHVKGALEQVEDLIQHVETEQLGAGSSWKAQLDAVRSAIADGRTHAACGMLLAFASTVESKSQGGVAGGVAASIVASAHRIRAVLGC